MSGTFSQFLFWLTTCVLRLAKAVIPAWMWRVTQTSLERVLLSVLTALTYVEQGDRGGGGAAREHRRLNEHRTAPAGVKAAEHAVPINPEPITPSAADGPELLVNTLVSLHQARAEDGADLVKTKNELHGLKQERALMRQYIDEVNSRCAHVVEVLPYLEAVLYESQVPGSPLACHREGLRETVRRVQLLEAPPTGSSIDASPALVSTGQPSLDRVREDAHTPWSGSAKALVFNTPGNR